MPTLIISDVWRDGGSLSAVVEDGDKKHSFWLSTNRWNHPSEKGHKDLYVSEGDNPQRKEQRIEISSIEEGQWLNYLLKVDDSPAGAESKKRFKELISVLEARCK